MPRMRTSVALLFLATLLGCNPTTLGDPRSSNNAPTSAGTPEDNTSDDPEAQSPSEDVRTLMSRLTPTGSSCAGKSDCPGQQICVNEACRYPETSVSGEILAASAQRLADGGSYERALARYEEAIEAFRTDGAPVSAEIACHAALVAIERAVNTESREQSAALADLCFRTAVPGFTLRTEVAREITRLRFRGLDISHFDRPEPVDNFFTERDGIRPTLEALTLSVHMPSDTERTTSEDEALIELQRPQTTHRLAQCFVEHWMPEEEHQVTLDIQVTRTIRADVVGTMNAVRTAFIIEPVRPVEDGQLGSCIADGLRATLPGSAFPQDSASHEWHRIVRVGATIR